MNIVGIDIGTTSICGISLDADTGKIIKSYTKNSEAFIKTPNAWEKIQSVEKIMEVAKDILEKIIDADTAVIGVTGQMHGIVYTDKDANAISPLYTWQDGRGNLEYKGTTYAEYLKSNTGYGAVTDFYNRINGIRPENAVSYCTIHDYLVMKLCELKMPVIHESDSKSFGECDMFVNPAEVVSGYNIAGKYKGIPVGVAIGDNQASVFSTVSDEDSILLNVGTGSQISVISDIPVIGENIETRPYFDGKYLIVGAALCGGRAYSLLKDFYKSIINEFNDADSDAVYAMMNKISDETESELVIDTRFDGTRSDKSVTGSITGITTENFTPGRVTSGVLKGMIAELFGMYEKMGVKKTGLVGSGNGIRKNPALVRCAERMFGSEMKIPMHMEEAAYGAALFAGVSAGVFKNSEEAHKLIRYEG